LNYARASQALNDSGPRESPLWMRSHNINTPAPGTFTPLRINKCGSVYVAPMISLSS
jgi:hypothetical protein